MTRRCDNQNNTGNNTDFNLGDHSRASAREMAGMRELARPIKQVTTDFSELPHEPVNVDYLGRGDGK
jgi:hypothetical protein